MPTRAGERKHKITILEKQLIKKPHGKIEEWVSVSTVRCKVTQPNSTETDSEHGTTRKKRLVIFTRFKNNISEDNRLTYINEEYDITSCRDVKGNRRELIIDAEKRS